VAWTAALLLLWPTAASAWPSGSRPYDARSPSRLDERHRDAGAPVGGPPRGDQGPSRWGYDRPYRPRYGRWSPGQILPPDAPAVVITDYERFHLRRPPQGYMWLNCDGDFVLAASASGLIFEVIPGGGE
jgi:Ni/Co efflux regulator RcnB